MKYEYFIAFLMPYGGYGNTTVTLDEPLTSYDRIMNVESMLEDVYNRKPIAIINFILLHSKALYR